MGGQVVNLELGYLRFASGMGKHIEKGPEEGKHVHGLHFRRLDILAQERMKLVARSMYETDPVRHTHQNQPPLIGDSFRAVASVP